jgi:hypothetical protein
MRQLKVDLSELEFAFDSSREMVSYYLDVETGEVIFLTDEAHDLWERIYKSYYGEVSEKVDWEKAFAEEGIGDWQGELVLLADAVEAGLGTRFISIPKVDSHEGFEDMEDFTARVSSQRVQERLERALDGRGPFRNFKNVLLDFPAERERWFRFKGERDRRRVLDWLEEEGITPLE